MQKNLLILGLVGFISILSLPSREARATVGPDADCPPEQTPDPTYDSHCGNNMSQEDSQGAMAHVRVRDQGHSNTCFAQTAAEQVDAWRFTHGDTQYDMRSSAVAAAI